MKLIKTIAIIASLLLTSSCLHIMEPKPILPPTPPTLPPAQTLTVEEIGKKHQTVDNGLTAINSNAATSKTSAEFIKKTAEVVVPENKDIPKAAEAIVENSTKTAETVDTLKKENNDLRVSAITAKVEVDRLTEDGKYMRTLFDQTKELYEKNVKAIDDAAKASVEDQVKKANDLKEEAVKNATANAEEKIKNIQAAANDKIKAANDHAAKVDAENATLKTKCDGLQKFIESALGKIFVPFIAIGALLLAAGVGSFFGLYSLAGNKSFGLMASGGTLICIGTAMPMLANAVAKTIEGPVTIILFAIVSLVGVALFAYLAWLIWQRIQSIRQAKQLVETTALYKKAVEANDATTASTDGTVKPSEEIRTQVMSIQSADTQNLVKTIRHYIGDKKVDNLKKDIPSWLMGIIIFLLVVGNGALIWFSFFHL